MSAEARRAMEAARARVGDLVRARVEALEEARRLRDRAKAGEGLAELAGLAEGHEARADELLGEIEAARADAHAAETAFERARAAEG